MLYLVDTPDFLSFFVSPSGADGCFDQVSGRHHSRGRAFLILITDITKVCVGKKVISLLRSLSQLAPSS